MAHRAEEAIQEMGATPGAIEAEHADAAACATPVRNAAATALARMGESKEPPGRQK